MQNTINRDDIIKIIKLGRPQYVVGDFLLFTMGALLAILISAPFSLSKFLMGYSILFLAHLSVHYSNDYFDVKVDQYNNPTVISGGSGMLLENPHLMQFSKWFSIVLMSISVGIAGIFTIIFNYSIGFFLFFLFGNLLAWFYTAPPLKLVYRQLGEVANIIAVIIFLGAGYFTLMGTLDIPFWIFIIPVIFFQIIFICSFEIPDINGDKLGKKPTLMVVKGSDFGFKIIFISSLLATLSFLIIPYTNSMPEIIDFHILTLISLISLILSSFELLKRPFSPEKAIKFSILNVITLFIMSFLIDVYFISIIL